MTIRLVVGPPGAGKSTYLKEHANNAKDLIIEWDDLAKVHGSARASDIRRVLEASAKDWEGGDVWITRSHETELPDKRQEHVDRIGVDEVIVLETDAETAKARVSERDKDDPEKVTALHDAIDRWWGQYGVVASDVIVKPSGSPPSDMEKNKMPKGFPDNTKVEDMTDAEAAAYWKYHSRKHEQALKDLGNIEELKQKAQNWDDHEKNRDKNQEDLDTQLQNARTEGRTEALRETALDRVKETFRTRIGERRTEEEIDDFLEDIDLTKFVSDDHKVDSDRITKKVELFAPAGDQKPRQQRRTTSTHQGERQNTGLSGVAAGKALFEEMNKKG